MSNDEFTMQDWEDLKQRAFKDHIKALKLMKSLLEEHISALEIHEALPKDEPLWEPVLFTLANKVNQILGKESDQREVSRWIYGIEKDVEARKIKAVIEIWQWLCAVAGDHIPQEELDKVHLFAKLGDPM